MNCESFKTIDILKENSRKKRQISGVNFRERPLHKSFDLGTKIDKLFWKKNFFHAHIWMIFLVFALKKSF